MKMTPDIKIYTVAERSIVSEWIGHFWHPGKGQQQKLQGCILPCKVPFKQKLFPEQQGALVTIFEELERSWELGKKESGGEKLS